MVSSPVTTSLPTWATTGLLSQRSDAVGVTNRLVGSPPSQEIESGGGQDVITGGVVSTTSKVWETSSKFPQKSVIRHVTVMTPSPGQIPGVKMQVCNSTSGPQLSTGSPSKPPKVAVEFRELSV